MRNHGHLVERKEKSYLESDLNKQTNKKQFNYAIVLLHKEAWSSLV